MFQIIQNLEQSKQWITILLFDIPWAAELRVSLNAVIDEMIVRPK